MSGANSLPGVVTHWLNQIGLELVRSQARFAPLSSSHEAYAVLAEEVDEFWDAVKANAAASAEMEAVQIAATALRVLVERQPMDKRNGAS